MKQWHLDHPLNNYTPTSNGQKTYFYRGFKEKIFNAYETYQLQKHSKEQSQRLEKLSKEAFRLSNPDRDYTHDLQQWQISYQDKLFKKITKLEKL